MFLLQQDMTIFSVDNSVKNVHDFGMITFRFPYESEYAICNYPGECQPPSSRQCIRWSGGYCLEGAVALCGRKDLFLNFTQHNRGSCRNVKFYKTLSIELFHGVYLVRNLIVAAIFLVVRGELNNKFL